MIWYYAKDNQKIGPYSEIDFKKLIKTGVIDLNTLVWRKGMASWQPLSKIAKNIPPALKSTEPEAVPLIKCSQCGKSFPRQELIRFENLSVCAACKPIVLQKLKEGVQVRDPDKTELENLLKVAKAQKGVIRNILLGFLIIMLFVISISAKIPSVIGVPIFIIAELGLIISQIIYCYRLADSLKMSTPILWVLGMILCGIIGLILLIYLSSKANTMLKAAGFKVGLMGANIKEIEKVIILANRSR